ncbi:MAG: DUF6522 family protein [Methylovirgula sp.]
MQRVEFQDGAIEVDAAIVAAGLGIEPSLLRERIRAAKITSSCERGINEDDGRYRLTFLSDGRRLRLTVDEKGHVLQRSAIDFCGRLLPRSLPQAARLNRAQQAAASARTVAFPFVWRLELHCEFAD